MRAFKLGLSMEEFPQASSIPAWEMAELIGADWSGHLGAGDENAAAALVLAHEAPPGCRTAVWTKSTSTSYNHGHAWWNKTVEEVEGLIRAAVPEVRRRDAEARASGVAQVVEYALKGGASPDQIRAAVEDAIARSAGPASPNPSPDAGREGVDLRTGTRFRNTARDAHNSAERRPNAPLCDYACLPFTFVMHEFFIGSMAPDDPSAKPFALGQAMKISMRCSCAGDRERDGRRACGHHASPHCKNPEPWPPRPGWKG